MSSGGGNFESSGSNRSSVTSSIDDLTVRQTRISSHSDTILLDTSRDLRTPSPDYRAWSDTEGAYLAPSSGRRKSWFKRMFSKDSDVGTLSRGHSHLDLDKSISDVELGIPLGKIPAKLKPLKTKRKKRSKSAVAVTVELQSPVEKGESYVKNKCVQGALKEEFKPIKDVKSRQKSVTDNLVGSMHLDINSSKSRLPSMSDGDGILNPRGETCREETGEESDIPKQSRTGSKKSNNKDAKKFGSVLKIASSNDALKEQASDTVSVKSDKSSSANTDKKTNSINKVARLVMALSSWQRKSKSKQAESQEEKAQENEPDLNIGSYNVELDIERNEATVMKKTNGMEGVVESIASDGSVVKAGNSGIQGGMFPDEESETWGSDEEMDEKDKIQGPRDQNMSSVTSQVMKSQHSTLRHSGYVDNNRDYDSNAYHEDLDEWYSDRTADIQNSVNADDETVDSHRKGSNFETIGHRSLKQTSKDSINLKMRKITEKSTEGVIETDDSDWDNEPYSVNDCNIEEKYDRLRNYASNEMRNAEYMAQNIIATDESEEEMDKYEEDRKKKAKIVANKKTKNLSRKIIETDESEEENEMHEENRKLLTQKGIGDNNFNTKVVNSPCADNRTDQVNEHVEFDEVDGYVAEAYYIKAARQPVNCLACTR